MEDKLKLKCRLAKIPPRYIGKTFADYQPTAFNTVGVQIAKWLVEDKPEKGAYFYGGSGTGKTFLASIVAQEYIADGYSALFVDVPSLCDSTFNPCGLPWDFLKEFMDADIVVLDDIGLERVTTLSKEQVYMLINGRYNEGKPTLVTSNYDFDGLIERYGGNIFAQKITFRLKEMTAQGFLGNHDRRQ